MRSALFNIPFFASAGWEAVDGTHLTQFFIIITCLASLAYVLKKLFIKDPPMHKEYQTTKECDRRCEITNERLKGMGKANYESREDFRKKISELEKKQAATEATTTSIDQRLSRMEMKIDRILEGKNNE